MLLQNVDLWRMRSREAVLLAETEKLLACSLAPLVSLSNAFFNAVNPEMGQRELEYLTVCFQIQTSRGSVPLKPALLTIPATRVRSALQAWTESICV